MFGITWVELPPHFYRAGVMLAHIGGTDRTLLYIFLAFIIVIMCKSSTTLLNAFLPNKQYFIATATLYAIGITLVIETLLSQSYTEFIYFNF